MNITGKRIAHVLITNREEEFDTAVFEEELLQAAETVSKFSNPDSEEMYDVIASGKFDIVITSLFFPIQWGWNTVRTHAPAIRSIMSGYPLAHPDVKNIFISFAGPFHIYELAYMDPFLVTYGECPAAQMAAAKAIAGQIPVTGRVPVSLEGFFKRGDGEQR